jgi:hypothetical protein
MTFNQSNPGDPAKLAGDKPQKTNNPAKAKKGGVGGGTIVTAVVSTGDTATLISQLIGGTPTNPPRAK